MAQNLGTILQQPPLDGVTQLQFSTESNLLVASSWDQTIRVYDAALNQALATFQQPAPVLDVAYPDDSTAYCGLLDGSVRRVGLPQGLAATMGQHEAAVRCVQFLQGRGLLVSGSWDQTLKVWDPRSSTPMIKSIQIPGRVFCMSAAKDNLVVGTSGRHVLVYDVRKLEYGQPDQQRESSLKFQTRCIACYPDGRGYALGSVEGRVAMELLDLRPEVQAGKYAFKCHRRAEEGKGEVVYPVHCITYHQGYGTFATGGGDGVVNLWDGDNKKRLFQISRYPTSVAAMAFSRDGQMLAVASSYAYEQGERPHEADAIYIRPVSDAEVRPKAKLPR